MTDTDLPSRWIDVTADAMRWTVDALDSGDLDPSDEDGTVEWIDETADGCAHVIWTDNAWSLWRDPAAPDQESEPTLSTDPGELLTRYAFDVVRQALTRAVESLTGPDAPDWGLCTACRLPVYADPDAPAGLTFVEVRQGGSGGTLDWCTVADDHKHRKGTRA